MGILLPAMLICDSDTSQSINNPLSNIFYFLYARPVVLIRRASSIKYASLRVPFIATRIMTVSDQPWERTTPSRAAPRLTSPKKRGELQVGNGMERGRTEWPALPPLGSSRARCVTATATPHHISPAVTGPYIPAILISGRPTFPPDIRWCNYPPPLRIDQSTLLYRRVTRCEYRKGVSPSNWRLVPWRQILTAPGPETLDPGQTHPPHLSLHDGASTGEARAEARSQVRRLRLPLRGARPAEWAPGLHHAAAGCTRFVQAGRLGSQCLRSCSG